MPIKIVFYLKEVEVKSRRKKEIVRQLKVLMNESQSEYATHFYSWYHSKQTPSEADCHPSISLTQWEANTQNWVQTLQTFFEEGAKERLVNGHEEQPIYNLVKEARDVLRLALIFATVGPIATTYVELSYCSMKAVMKQTPSKI